MLLHHGTTQTWAENILANGPDPYFKPPGVVGDPEGFFTAIPGGPFPFGSPEQAARSQAKNYPNTGPSVILEIEIPDDLWPELVGPIGQEEPDKGVDHGGEVWFGIDVWDTGIDYGAAKLRHHWPQLTKRILLLEDE